MASLNLVDALVLLRCHSPSRACERNGQSSMATTYTRASMLLVEHARVCNHHLLDVRRHGNTQLPQHHGDERSPCWCWRDSCSCRCGCPNDWNNSLGGAGGRKGGLGHDNDHARPCGNQWHSHTIGYRCHQLKVRFNGREHLRRPKHIVPWPCSCENCCHAGREGDSCSGRPCKSGRHENGGCKARSRDYQGRSRIEDRSQSRASGIQTHQSEKRRRQDHRRQEKAHCRGDCRCRKQGQERQGGPHCLRSSQVCRVQNCFCSSGACDVLCSMPCMS